MNCCPLFSLAEMGPTQQWSDWGSRLAVGRCPAGCSCVFALLGPCCVQQPEVAVLCSGTRASRGKGTVLYWLCSLFLSLFSDLWLERLRGRAERRAGGDAGRPCDPERHHRGVQSAIVPHVSSTLQQAWLQTRVGTKV